MGNAWTTAQIPSDVKGKLAIVTGANSGTGYYTALGLGQAGATVVLACRSQERGQQALEAMKAVCPEGRFELKLLDLSNLKDVARFAADFNKEGRPLDILVNNAGIMKPPYALSVDGFESQLAANHLGHFALVGRLMPSLEKSAAAAAASQSNNINKPRVVVVSSLAAWRGAKDPHAASNNKTSTSAFGVDFVKREANSSTANATNDDGYNADAVYAETKLANLLFMRELSRRYPNLIMAVAAHPGITASNLWQHNAKQDLLKRFMQSSESGALPILRAATEPIASLVSGESYFAPRGFGWAGAPVGGWFPPLAKDEAYCKAYWEASVAATGVDY